MTRGERSAGARTLVSRLAVVTVIALAVLAHHGAAVPLPGATGHGVHGACADCPPHDDGGTGAAGLLAVCLAVGAAGLALPRVHGAVARLRAVRHRSLPRHGGVARPAPPRPPPRPPDPSRLCVFLR